MASGGRCNGLADTRVSFYLLFKSRRPLLNAAVPTRAFFHRVAIRWREAAGTSAQTFNLSRGRMTPGTLTEGLGFSLEARLTSAPGVHSQSDQKQFCFFPSFLPSLWFICRPRPRVVPSTRPCGRTRYHPPPSLKQSSSRRHARYRAPCINYSRGRV